MEEALGPRGAHGRWWNDPALVEKLKLTDEQRKSMDAILLEHREKLIDMRAAVEKGELELEPLMRDDQPNEAKILAQIDKVAQARAELEKANARFLLAIRSKLSPEQWKQLQADRAERGSRMQRRGWQRDAPGRGPGGRDGGDSPGRGVHRLLPGRAQDRRACSTRCRRRVRIRPGTGTRLGTRQDSSPVTSTYTGDRHLLSCIS